MINSNIKIYCNDEPILTLCNIYDNNTPISIEKLNSLASFETMHNTKNDAHKNLFYEVKSLIYEQENKINLKANIDDLPTKVSELENDVNYLTEHQDISHKASIDLDNLTVEGLKKLEYRKASKLTNFTANSGNLDNNYNADLFACNGNTLSFKVGGEYPELYVTNAQGESYKKESLKDIVFSAQPYTATGNYKNIAKNDNFRAFTGCGDCTNAMLNGGNILLRSYKGYQSVYLQIQGDTPFKLKNWTFANRDNQGDNGYAPTYWTLQASNNNVDWDILTSKVCSATKYQGSVQWEWDINSMSGYKYYKFIGSGMTGGTNETGQVVSSISFRAEYDYVTSNDDGTYNIMVPQNGDAYAIQNKIIKQKNQPEAFHNYSVVGLIDVDKNDMASGFSETNGIDTIKLLPENNSWEVCLRVIFKPTPTGTGSQYLIYNSTGDRGLIITHQSWSQDALECIVQSSNATIYPNVSLKIYSSDKAVEGDILDIRFKYNSSTKTYTTIAFKNNELWCEGFVQSDAIIRQADTGFIRLGSRSGNANYCRGAIDLSKFVIKINGVEIYRAITHDSYIWLDTSIEPLKAYRNDGIGLIECEDVPIGTITLEGAQIVNSETYPYANMESEVPNRVLPATIIETSDKSFLPSWYRVWSDGWCEQGGKLSGDGSVAFLKTYKDTNYTITLASLGSEGVPRISSKFVDKFSYNSARTANTPANWVVKGFIK